jgi:hypothetical protein
MVELKVYRNGRCSNKDVEKTVKAIWNEDNPDVVGKYSKGVATASAKAISDSMLMVQEVYGGCLNAKVHCCELSFDKNIEVELAAKVTKVFMDYLVEEYQGIAVTEANEDGIKSRFVINAMSYNDGSKFNDNNRTYCKLGTVVDEICGEPMSMQMDESVLFRNENNNRNNYVTLDKLGEA